MRCFLKVKITFRRNRINVIVLPFNKWNVSNVTDMDYTFDHATSFNQPLHAPWYQDGMHEESESE